MQVRYESASTGQRRAVTSGLMAMGQAELALELTMGVPDEAAERVLRYVSDYVAKSGQHVRANETMRYGWSTIRFAPTTSAELLNVEELANPLSPTADTYITGAAKAISILTTQDATAKRNGVARPGHHPHRSEMAVLCRRLRPTPPPKVMVFDRLKAGRSEDSGWFLGCGNPNHNHNDPGELTRLHLIHILTLDSRIISYLAMPEDTRIVFDHGKVLVFGPGQDEGRLDDAGQE
jgi:hypothetical protein